MSSNAVGTILAALEGASRREWELIREYIDREFDAEARRVTLSPLMATHIQQRLAAEQSLGEAKPREADKQMKIF